MRLDPALRNCAVLKAVASLGVLARKMLAAEAAIFSADAAVHPMQLAGLEALLRSDLFPPALGVDSEERSTSGWSGAIHGGPTIRLGIEACQVFALRLAVAP